MASDNDTGANAFDFDAYPATGTITVIPVGYARSDEWDEQSTLPTLDLATNPLVATFSDLDLAPAREILLAPEFDAEYWQD
jgi:hypothetical protein